METKKPRFYLRTIDLCLMFILGFSFLIASINYIMGVGYLFSILGTGIILTIQNYLRDLKKIKMERNNGMG